MIETALIKDLEKAINLTKKNIPPHGKSTGLTFRRQFLFVATLT